eukprot:Gregarina_sp_Poly_1__6330@NODE_336_length_9439_cov_243_466709_g284_i0_p3_GENE_NODE_336_length_9439_cov_243_466709_g284_i0NODE_336_length_9439_cov_243_466709_g284_i0_p3_ORF_typecomplete_len252_score8_52SWIM/PF04434_17/4_3e05_NODE_336_length_9439_cov_243_466709_g284_i027233478
MDSDREGTSSKRRKVEKRKKLDPYAQWERERDIQVISTTGPVLSHTPKQNRSSQRRASRASNADAYSAFRSYRPYQAWRRLEISHGIVPDLPRWMSEFGISNGAWVKGNAIVCMEDGILVKDDDPYLFVVYSDTANARLVDLARFHCDCPNEGICSHLIAVSIKQGVPFSTVCLAHLVRSTYDRLSWSKHGSQEALFASIKEECVKRMKDLKKVNDEFSGTIMLGAIVRLACGMIFREQLFSWRSNAVLEV